MQDDLAYKAGNEREKKHNTDCYAVKKRCIMEGNEHTVIYTICTRKGYMPKTKENVLRALSSLHPDNNWFFATAST